MPEMSGTGKLRLDMPGHSVQAGKTSRLRSSAALPDNILKNFPISGNALCQNSVTVHNKLLK